MFYIRPHVYTTCPKTTIKFLRRIVTEHASKATVTSREEKLSRKTNPPRQRIPRENFKRNYQSPRRVVIYNDNKRRCQKPKSRGQARRPKTDRFKSDERRTKRVEFIV